MRIVKTYFKNRIIFTLKSVPNFCLICIMDLTKQDKMYSKKVREDKKKVLFMSIYPDESNYL